MKSTNNARYLRLRQMQIILKKLIRFLIWNFVLTPLSYLPLSLSNIFPRKHNLIILCFHDVIKVKDLRRYSRNLTYDKSQLVKLIRKLRNSGYNFIYPQKLNEIDSLKGKNVLLTFDDCYQSFHEIVQEISIVEDIPVLFFITTEMLLTSTPWWVKFDLFVQSQKDVVIPMQTSQFLTSNGILKSVNYKLLTDKFRRNLEEDPFKSYCKFDSRACNENTFIMQKRLNLDFQELKKLGSSDNCTLASHGKRHLSAYELSNFEIIENFNSARDYLKSITKNVCASICYPYGHLPLEPGFESIARLNGYSHGLTTRFEHIDSDMSSSFNLGRLVVTNKMSPRMVLFLDSTIVQRIMRINLISRLFNKF